MVRCSCIYGVKLSHECFTQKPEEYPAVVCCGRYRLSGATFLGQPIFNIPAYQASLAVSRHLRSLAARCAARTLERIAGRCRTLHRPQTAARICVAGGLLVATCLIDAVALICWWFGKNPHYGRYWTTTENLLGLLLVAAFGLLWAIFLVIRGWLLWRQTATAQPVPERMLQHLNS